jgi:hypothetical protein
MSQKSGDLVSVLAFMVALKIQSPKLLICKIGLKSSFLLQRAAQGIKRDHLGESTLKLSSII